MREVSSQCVRCVVCLRTFLIIMHFFFPVFTAVSLSHTHTQHIKGLKVPKKHVLLSHESESHQKSTKAHKKSGRMPRKSSKSKRRRKHSKKKSKSIKERDNSHHKNKHGNKMNDLESVASAIKRGEIRRIGKRGFFFRSEKKKQKEY